MKKGIIALLVTAAVGVGAVLMLGQTSAAADSPEHFASAGFRGRDFGGPGFGGRGFGRIAAKLGLSDAQKETIRGILTEARTNITPHTTALRENHEALARLGVDGVYNEAEAERLATEQAAIMKQLIVEKEKTKARIFAELTPEQRVKANELKEDFRSKFKRRFGGFFRGETNPAGGGTTPAE